MNLPQQPKNYFESFLQEEKIKYIPSHVKKILDIGCGDGSVFDNTRYEVHGYDIDKNSLCLARNVTNYTHLSDDLSIYDPSTYDCVTILGTLEHMEEEDIASLFSHISSARSIYITVPNTHSFHRRVGLAMGIIQSLTQLQEHDHNIGHKRYYTPFTLQEAVSILPLKVAKVGSTTLKIDTSHNMIPFLNKMPYINKVAEQCNLVGENNFSGAELFIYLTR